MRTRRNRRKGAAALAVTAALALAAGLTTPASATPASATPAPGPSGAGQQHEPGRKGPVQITLITGDRVTADDRGRPIAFAAAKGREKIPVSVRTAHGRTSVVPFDAQRLIDEGRLDARLFDVTELGSSAYRARGDRLRLIVRYEGGSAPAAKAVLRSTGGLHVDRTLAFLGAEAVSADAGRAAALWEALTDRRTGAQRTAAPGIATVWLDGIRTATLDKSTRQIGADKAWAAGYDGKGVKIAVLDTGIDATHPDLAGQVIGAQDFSGSGSPADRFGHGTHVASIAAGTGAKTGGRFKGVAPGAKLLNGKVLDDNGSGADSGILAGMEWAVTQGAQVVNLSLGGPDGPDIDPLEAAVNKLSAEKGVLFAISAGNSGPSATGTIGSPGSADAALTVGAVDDADVLARFSSTGPRTGDGAVKPDVTAPGVDITAAAAPGSVIEREVGQNPAGYLTISGTSMAAPHAAGAAALLKQQNPQRTGAELKGILTASTKPGAYTAFEQGSGRIAVDRALAQSVVAEPVSLGFTGQPWPHHDDTPQKKRLSYRNLGNAPVTLALSVTVTGPDGKPAPAGFLAFDAPKVTVPAGGTASVGLTLNTKLGSVDGRYAAYAVATAPGGQAVRTAVAAEREVESYDLTLKHIGRDGKPAKDYGTTLVGLAADGRRADFHNGSGSETVRVPKGRYLLNASIVADPADLSKGVDWITQPGLDLTRDTTVNLDARTTKPVDITVPSRNAVMGFAMPSYTLTEGEMGYGFGWFLDSYAPLRTRSLGPDAAPGTLSQQWDAHWRDGDDEEYHAALGGTVKRLATGYTRHLKASDLATVVVEQGASAPGKKGAAYATGWIPGGSGGSSLSSQRPLPATVTMHLSAVDGAKWDLGAFQSGGADENGFPIDETHHRTDRPTAYQAGTTHKERFGGAVAGPRVDAAAGLTLYRKGDELFGTLPLLADGAGHDGRDFLAKPKTVLYRNGAVVGSQDAELADTMPFHVPSAAGSYKLVAQTTRPAAVSRTSAKVTATWWFRSATTPAGEPTPLPASAVRFTPDLTLTGTSPAGRTVRVPVTVQGAAATGKALKSLTVSVSYDDGYTWRELPVQGGAVQVRNPAAGGHVSLRGTVVDTAGNKSEVAVTRAYFTD
ncbi:S8 family serine peptidase [Streptomyces sp. NPDC089799]|uniref:S8 family serine peptidase n=1 Tax=Streptomyces sp. NPDC089799 TaxID=3155066 RepID=UPI00341B7498